MTSFAIMIMTFSLQKTLFESGLALFEPVSPAAFPKTSLRFFHKAAAREIGLDALDEFATDRSFRALFAIGSASAATLGPENIMAINFAIIIHNWAMVGDFCMHNALIKTKD